MGCGSGSCGTGAPGGCGSKGNCASGSCNRLNVHDWLSNLPLADADSACRVMEVSFNQGSRKDFYRNTTLHLYEKGEMIAVEGVNGFDVGQVSLTGELVRLQLKKYKVEEKSPDMRKVLRRATETDLDKLAENKPKEAQMLIRSRAIARQLRLDMKIAEVELQADGRKGTYFYIADGRVDFRELIKLYAAEFKVKVEMRQIGARQEAGKVGGIGSCGRELCCATWLTDFKSVNTNAARYQNLSINQAKLSGQCGRLKCCLNYELDTYMDALQFFPKDADMLETARGRAFLVKKDIFKNLMWYSMPESTKHYPVSIDVVKKIKAMNREGIRPEELEVAEVQVKNPKEVEPEYADLVGQISLRSLEKTTRRRRDRERSKQEPRGKEQGAKGNRQPITDNKQETRGNRQQATGNKQGANRPQPGGRSQNQPQQNRNRGPRPNRNQPPRPPQSTAG